MHAIDSGKKKLKGMTPVEGRFPDGKLIFGDKFFCSAKTSLFLDNHEKKDILMPFLVILQKQKQN
jgi:hypothetical protein